MLEKRADRHCVNLAKRIAKPSAQGGVTFTHQYGLGADKPGSSFTERT